MVFARFTMAVAVLFGTVGPLCARQDEEKRSPPQRRMADDGVPLEKLPLPANGTVVVTPDLKKALDALGAGSVVLSAERYRELMQRQAAQGQDRAGDVLFSALRIEGEVKSAAGREVAELVFELEFRTDSANVSVPVPFKGVRFSSATLNGASPVWGPDPEKLSVLVKEPQACKLRLTAAVPLTRVGNERRLSLERVPTAAVTALDLGVPGNVSQAFIFGAVPVPVVRGKDGAARLQSNALGILNGLDLSWQLGEHAAGQNGAAIEGDIRVTLEDGAAQVEARLRPVPFAPLQLPWKVRLPDVVTQLRAELLRTEALGSEPLVVTRGADGSYAVTSPYPTTGLDFAQVVIRWRQPLGEADLKAKVVLGGCELVDPPGRTQTGTITVTVPETPTIMLRPVVATLAERDTPPGRDSRIIRYRYSRQPAGLEAVALPASLVRGAVEFKLLHTLTVREGVWLLTTDLDITRTARAQLTTIDFAWPADWVVSRKVLFSPVVREFEQDAKAQRLRLILDGKLPGTFSIHLESSPSANPAQATLALPDVAGAQGTQNERLIPVELVAQQEQLKLEPRNWELKVDPMTTGLREEEAVGEGSQFQIIQRPATLVVTREPRLPKYRCRAELFAGKDVIQTRQTFDLRWNGPAPRRLIVLVPQDVRGVQFFRRATDSARSEPLAAPVVRGSGEATPSGWESRALELPSGTGPGMQLVCLVDVPAGNPATVPLVRFAEGQASPDGPVEARVTYDQQTTLKVPELPGWHLLSEGVGEVELRGNSLDQLLALELTPAGPAPGIPLARVRDCQVWVDGDPTKLLARYVWNFDEVRTTELTLSVPCPAEEVTSVQWALDDQPLQAEVRSRAAEGGTEFVIKLPARRLRQPLQLKVTLQFTPPAPRYLLRVPAARWASGGVVEGPRTWRVTGEPASWLLGSNLCLDETFLLASSWLPAAARPAGDSTYALVFHDDGRADALWAVTAPRSAVVLILSIVALGSIRTLVVRPGRLRRAAYVVPVLLVLTHLAEPPAAAALLWGLLPGAAVALLLLTIERTLSRRRSRRPAVFQSGSSSATITPAPATPSGRSVVLAEAPTLVPETRSSVP